MLDVFSYAGGWGIQATVAGAASVVCVDASQTAVNAVLHNARLNNIEDKVSALCAKAVEGLKELIGEGKKIDVIELDPPALIKKRKDQDAGETAYLRINELAIQLLNRGGPLVSASCSMPLTAETLFNIVHGSAHKQNREAQLIYTGSQSVDHPIHSAIRETQYLKALFYRV